MLILENRLQLVRVKGKGRGFKERPECPCCCYREPYVIDPIYMGVYAGVTPDRGSCVKLCSSNPKIYAGFMSCTEGFGANCSALSNEQLADEIEYYRKFYSRKVWAGFDLSILRGK